MRLLVYYIVKQRKDVVFMLKAGFARLDITPPLGTELTGYFQVRISDGILDPIYLNALALGDGDNTVLVITGDFMYLREASATYYRTLIEERTGISKDSILIHTIHQHTSTTAGKEGPTDAEYQDMLARKYCDVAQMALADMSEATPSYAEGETAEPISFVRRFKMKDGSTQTNPGRLNPDIDYPLGDADNTVRFVRFTREGKKDIALVNFQTHPDVIGGNKFSADWPGFVRTFTEKELGVHCIFVNGCQGDVNHINVFGEKLPKEHSARYGHSMHMGQAVTDVVTKLWDNTAPLKEGRVSCQIKYAHISSNTAGVERIEEMTKFYNDYVAGKITKESTMASIGEARRIATMPRTMLVQDVPVTVVAFGDVAILGYAGEPFTEYAVELRDAFPRLHVMSACLANGAQGYLPSAAAFAEGGYEAHSSEFTACLAPTLRDIATELLQNVRDGKAVKFYTEKAVEIL